MRLEVRVASRVALMLFSVILIAAMLPATSAAPVNIFAVDDTYKEVAAGSSVTFEWVLYNNDTVPYVIMPSSVPEGYTDVAVNFDKNYIVIYPGGSKSINMTVTPAAEMSSAVLPFEVQFNVTQLNLVNNTYIVNGTVHVEIDPIYGAKAGDNKILGMWDNDLPYPLDGNAGAFVVSVGIWAGIALFVLLIADPSPAPDDLQDADGAGRHNPQDHSGASAADHGALRGGKLPGNIEPEPGADRPAGARCTAWPS